MMLMDILKSQLPQMKPYPHDRSVLLLDNCNIHSYDYLRAVVEAHGAYQFILRANPPNHTEFVQAV